jgi:cell division protein FtsW
MFQKLKKWIQPGSLDTVFMLIVFGLLTVGIVMMFSASYVSASYLTNNPYFYFKKQVMYAALGLFVMFVVSRVRLELFKRWSFWLLGACVLLLLLVLVMPMKIDDKEGFRRWLGIPGVFSFQPSEVAKLGLILICARALSSRVKAQRKLGEKDYSIPVCLVMTAGMSGLVLLEHHLSGTLLMLGIGAVMLVLGGVDKKWIALVLGAAFFGLLLFMIFKEKLIEPLPIKEYQKARIIAWINKEADPTGDRWQTNQSLYAIGSGGLFGLGLGQSKQKFLYMPEPQNDFVFAIVCEELGFVGAVLILAAFAVLIWRGFDIAMRNKDRYSALVVMGIMSHVALQVVLNILVVTDTIPNTGIGLPFFSYGGSSLFMLLAEMGLVLSASRASTIRKR